MTENEAKCRKSDGSDFAGNSDQQHEATVHLRKELGLLSAVSLIIGSMIGSGIFIAPTSALRHTKSVGLSLIIWAVCGIISFMGALSLAELGSIIPKSGGEITYMHEAYGPLHRYWGQVPSFICSWVTVLVLSPASEAVVCMTFAEYVIKPVVEIDSMDVVYRTWLKKLISVTALGVMVGINIWSVKFYNKLQNMFTMSKLSVCMVIIVCGVSHLITGKTENLSDSFENSTTSPNDIALSFYSCLWAYGGWNMVNIVAEEVKHPEINILRSLSIAVPFVTLIYLLINLSYMSVLSVPEILESPAVAVVFGEHFLSSFNFIIPLGVACSTFGSALNGVFSKPRLTYIASKNGHMINCFSFVHIERMTPVPAVLLHGLFSLVYIITGELTSLLELCEFLGWIFYGFVMVGLIIMRKTHQNSYRPFKVPLIVPYMIILVAVFLASVPIVLDPSPKYLLSIVLILIGVMVYTIFVYYQLTPKRHLDQFTWFVQMLLKVVPPDVKLDESRGNDTRADKENKKL